MSGPFNRPAHAPLLNVEECLYLSVGLGLSLLQTRNRGKNPEDAVPCGVKSVVSKHLHATARELISTRKDIQEFVLWLKTPDDIEENGEEDEVPEVEAERHIEAPDIIPVTPSFPTKSVHHTFSAGLSGTAGTDSEVQDSLASFPSTGRSQSQGTGGTLLALMTAYDEHSNQPEVQRTIRYVASLLG
jgi:hypothetical protein